MTPTPPNVPELLRNWRDGEKQAQERLFQIVYHELDRQAARYLRRESRARSFQTTDLIHEAYLRLIDQRHVRWQNRLHFFAISAKVMRHLLVDHARNRQAAKRGGSGIRLPLEDATLRLQTSVGWPQQPTLTAIPHADLGFEGMPSLSPDGSQVAYASGGPQQG